jgi:tungstate transport system permease protein
MTGVRKYGGTAGAPVIAVKPQCRSWQFLRCVQTHIPALCGFAQACAIGWTMQDFTDALHTAAALIAHLDPELRDIVALSLGVSLTASICAFAIGSPFGTALAMYRFPGRGVLIVIANALLGLPPVVVGLVVYLLLSRSGPLGSFGILFTPTAMVIAQSLLGIPIVIALVHRMSVDNWAAYGDALLIDGASRLRAMIPIMLIGREGLLTAFLAAFGRAIAGSRRDNHRRRQYPGLYAHDDNRYRPGDEQGRIELRPCFGNYSHHPVDDSKRTEPCIWTRLDGSLNEHL